MGRIGRRQPTTEEFNLSGSPLPGALGLLSDLGKIRRDQAQTNDFTQSSTLAALCGEAGTSWVPLELWVSQVRNIPVQNFHKMVIPNAAKRMLAKTLIHPIGIRFKSFSPRNTARALDASIPKVVPTVTTETLE